MDITPHVNLLKSLRGERIDYVLLIGEAVDNAFDAGAASVAITVDDNHVEFVDTGAGIRRDRIAALFSLGRHGPQSTTVLGRFGIGITSQAVNAGDNFEVISTSMDGRVHASVSWRKVLNSGSWSVDDPRWLPVAIGAPTGTTITISGLRKPPKVAFDKIVDDLALRFYPALASGRIITVNGRHIPVLPEPSLIDIVDRQLSLSGGRSVHVRAGILTAPSRLNSVHVAYQHRVIMTGSRVGCGAYGGLTKMFARIQLSGPWHLAKFKNDLTDEAEREELEEAVAQALLPILEKCSSASLTARIRQMTSLINERIPPELRPSRPVKRKVGSTTGGKGKSDGPGNVDRDKSEEADTGPARSRRKPKDQLIINLDGSDAEQGVGKFIAGRPHCVNLSPDNPLVARLIEMRDQEIAVSSLVALALAIYLHEWASREPELPLFEKFGVHLAQLLSLQSGNVAGLKNRA